MKFQDIREYCVDKPGTHEDFPFDNETATFKVHEKMFALVNIRRWHEGDERMNLKCDPDRARELRERYASVEPGYHMNKKHWNTIVVGEGELSDEQIFDLIEHSYDQVYQSLPKKIKNS